MNKKDIGKKIRSLRKKNGLPQDELGMKVFGRNNRGGQSLISRIENGGINLENNELDKLLAFFNISVELFNSMITPENDEPPVYQVESKLIKDLFPDYEELKTYEAMYNNAIKVGNNTLRNAVLDEFIDRLNKHHDKTKKNK